MDLLFKRYADPFTLMNGYIATSRFCEFLHAFVAQQEENDMWEIYLHKVWDKSYIEFKEMLLSQGGQEMSKDDIETTLKMSMDILDNFVPDKEEGE